MSCIKFRLFFTRSSPVSLVSVLRFVSLTISYYKNLPRFDQIEVVKLTNVWNIWRAPEGLQLNKDPWQVFPPWKQDVPMSTSWLKAHWKLLTGFMLCWHILTEWEMHKKTLDRYGTWASCFQYSTIYSGFMFTYLSHSIFSTTTI